MFLPSLRFPEYSETADLVTLVELDAASIVEEELERTRTKVDVEQSHSLSGLAASLRQDDVAVEGGLSSATGSVEECPVAVEGDRRSQPPPARDDDTKQTHGLLPAQESEGSIVLDQAMVDMDVDGVGQEGTRLLYSNSDPLHCKTVVRLKEDALIPNGERLDEEGRGEGGDDLDGLEEMIMVLAGDDGDDNDQEEGRVGKGEEWENHEETNGAQEIISASQDYKESDVLDRNSVALTDCIVTDITKETRNTGTINIEGGNRNENETIPGHPSAVSATSDAAVGPSDETVEVISPLEILVCEKPAMNQGGADLISNPDDSQAAQVEGTNHSEAALASSKSSAAHVTGIQTIDPNTEMSGEIKQGPTVKKRRRAKLTASDISSPVLDLSQSRRVRPRTDINWNDRLSALLGRGQSKSPASLKRKKSSALSRGEGGRHDSDECIHGEGSAGVDLECDPAHYMSTELRLDPTDYSSNRQSDRYSASSSVSLNAESDMNVTDPGVTEQASQLLLEEEGKQNLVSGQELDKEQEESGTATAGGQVDHGDVEVKNVDEKVGEEDKFTAERSTSIGIKRGKYKRDALVLTPEMLADGRSTRVRNAVNWNERLDELMGVARDENRAKKRKKSADDPVGVSERHATVTPTPNDTGQAAIRSGKTKVFRKKNVAMILDVDGKAKGIKTERLLEVAADGGSKRRDGAATQQGGVKPGRKRRPTQLGLRVDPPTGLVGALVDGNKDSAFRNKPRTAGALVRPRKGYAFENEEHADPSVVIADSLTKELQSTDSTHTANFQVMSKMVQESRVHESREWNLQESVVRFAGFWRGVLHVFIQYIRFAQEWAFAAKLPEKSGAGRPGQTSVSKRRVREVYQLLVTARVMGYRGKYR